MPKVQLPPGCYGFDCKDGTKYTARKPGGTIEVSDQHAKSINEGQFGDTGLVSAKGALSFGTRKGRLCPSCNTIWNVWTKVCHKCDVETTEV